MVRAVTVTGEEPLEEVVPLDVPRLEQLDFMPPSSVAEEHLHRPEPGLLAADEDGAAEIADEQVERGAGVVRRQRDVIEVARRRR